MSIHSTIRNTLVVLVLAAAATATACARAADAQAPDVQVPDVQVVEMRQSRGTTMELGFGTSQWLYPLDEPAEQLLAEPDYASERIVRYSAAFGDAEDDAFAFVLDESKGTYLGYDTVYVDANNDDRIDARCERFSRSESSDSPCRIRLQVTTAGHTHPYYVDFTAFPYEKDGSEAIHANLRDSAYYRGRAVFAGKERRIAIADLDSNGRFDDPETDLFDGDRIFLDWDGDGEFDNEEETDGHNGYPYGRYTRIHGTWYSIVARPDGGQLEIREAKPALGRIEAAAPVVAADLRSEIQSCYVDLTAKEPKAIVGTYHLRGLTLRLKDADGDEWKVSAIFPKDALPEVVVPAEGTVRLPAGPPLRIEPTVTAEAGSRELSIELRITGRTGEVYRWPSKNPAAEQPGFAIVDAQGTLVHTARFEYG